MKLHLIFILNIFFHSIYCQVNTESFKKDHSEIGIKHSVELDFSYLSANTEIIQLMGSYQMHYLLKSSWYGFISGYYNRAFEKNKEDFTNRGFIHFRASKPLFNKIDFESFIQKESNYFIDLNNRNLFGIGIRINHFDNFYFGSGIMHEIESYNYKISNKTIKS